MSAKIDAIDLQYAISMVAAARLADVLDLPVSTCARLSLDLGEHITELLRIRGIVDA